MSGKTKIEWADRVFNPVTGCTKISRGCEHCYAERMSKRLAGRCGYPENGFKVTLHPEKLNEPLRWKKPSRIFVCSMGDLFHKNVTFDFIDRMMDTIFRCPQHIFLFLTKRPDRMAQYFEHLTHSDEEMGEPSWKNMPNPHIWLGTSVENKKEKWRIKELQGISAAKRFLSLEPLLEDLGELDLKGIDWVILGGESGPGARPLHPDWARSVRDQCKEAGVPYFFKQHGEWIHESQSQCPNLSYDGSTKVHEWAPMDRSFRVGKSLAGCLLDGKEHKELPR